MASYAGDIPVEEAWKILESEPDAQLIDVRTKAEWTFVGVPDLGPVNRQPILLEWQEYPSMEKNSGFAEALESADIPKDAPLLFLCRSGQRSAAAAELMTSHGYSRCYNFIDGFEGPADAARHRGTSGGWKARGLPWVQN
ncbi:MAG: rhodanese-like domain-containing protein [Alphaproteobacteria bacterium]|nr:rhodanese-like domain-containing protein [Alphaproteobacteria bacterium]